MSELDEKCNCKPYEPTMNLWTGKDIELPTELFKVDEKCKPFEPNTNSLTGKEINLRTEYNDEYTRKVGISYPLSKFDKPSPLEDPFKSYLVPREDMADRLPDGVPYENVDCVLHRAGVQWRPNVEVVRKAYELPPQTEYQFEFCLPGDYESERARSTHHVPLPDNWKFCETTYCGSYRVPSNIATFDLTPPKPDKYKDNLVPNVKEREIRRVRTGESDYMHNIGALGEFIMKEKLYGPRVPRGLTKWEAKRRLEELHAGHMKMSAL